MSEVGTDRLGDLLIAVGAGDSGAFAELYRASSPKLFGLCLRLVRQREIAQEVLQEAFVRVWQKAGLYDPGRGGALPWLIAVTRRCALDRLRQAGAAATVPLESSPEVEALEAPAAFGARDHDIRRCLGELRDQERRTVALAFVYGLSHTELSASLAVPLGTVKSWIRRGLRQLKECLER